jgi:hypothetical protein
MTDLGRMIRHCCDAAAAMIEDRCSTLFVYLLNCISRPESMTRNAANGLSSCVETRHARACPRHPHLSEG